MAIKHNIKETAIRQYVYDVFNENPLKIPFRMGTSTIDETAQELLVYSLKFADDGLFDIESKLDMGTYMATKKSVVIIELSGLAGDFVSHPNIKSGSFSTAVEVLVNIDSNMSVLIKQMIEYVRDSFIGKLDVLKVWERDWSNPKAKETEVNYVVVSNASSIDYGNPFEINGRRYMIFSFNIDMEISKDVTYGNQIEWEIGFYEDDGFSLGNLVKTEPLIASWATAQDTETMQVLRNSKANTKAREVHAYVKSRGYSLVFTYLLNLNNLVHKRFYEESFKIKEKPHFYYIKQQTKILNSGGEFVVDSILTEERKMVAESFVPNDIIYGEPIILSVGFLPSAK